MTSGSYADHEGPDYLLARVRPNSVSPNVCYRKSRTNADRVLQRRLFG